MHLACGLAVGFACLASGYAIGIVGDEGVDNLCTTPFICWDCVNIDFAEVLGLYGMIIALILNTKEVVNDLLWYVNNTTLLYYLH